MLTAKTKYIIKNYPIELEWNYTDVSGILIYSINKSKWKLLNYRITKKTNGITIFQNTDYIEFKLLLWSWFRLKKLSEYSTSPRSIYLVKPQSNIQTFSLETKKFNFLSLRKNPLLFKHKIQSKKLNTPNLTKFKINLNPFISYE